MVKVKGAEPNVFSPLTVNPLSVSYNRSPMKKGLLYDLAFIAITGIVLVLLNEFTEMADRFAIYLYIPMLLAYFIGKEVGKRVEKAE